MKIDELPSILTPLGFTETEALVYGELLRQPDQTGYGLAKAIRKGQPVTYAALSSLESKGAVMAGFAPGKAYRAIQPEELLAGLRSQFERRCDLARQRLVPSRVAPSTDQVFQLKSAQQVFERARSMIAEAETTILFELFPEPADVLMASLRGAVARKGLAVAGLVLRPEDQIEGARTILSARSGYIRSVWKQEVLVLITDARQVLIASLDSYGEVSRAMWTDSLFISVLFHNAITADVLLHEKMGPDWIGPNRDLFGRLPSGFSELTGDS